MPKSSLFDNHKLYLDFNINIKYYMKLVCITLFLKNKFINATGVLYNIPEVISYRINV